MPADAADNTQFASAVSQNSADHPMLLAAAAALAGLWQIKADNVLRPERQFQPAVAQQGE